MAPRQRLSPQPSMEDVSKTGESEPSTLTRPLLRPTSSNDSSSSTSSSSAEGRAAPKDAADAADTAREHHDFFNLVALVFVIAATAVDWNWTLLLQGYGAEAFNGAYFWWTWGTSTAYFLIDLIWVSLVPHCVKSPGTIVKHHTLVIAYLFGPIAFPEYRWFMGACLSVEINTWFLIMRRVVYKRNICFLSQAVSTCFYVSWIVIRCFIYPAILVTFLQLATRYIQETNELAWPMAFIPVHFVLCLLNLRWSYDLFLPIIKSWFITDAAAPTVSSGL